MYQDFIAERIAQLRLNMGVSARDMSLTMGQADNYINYIENKKGLPSMASFFYICEYLKVTPQEFFDAGNKNPEHLNDIITDLKKLDYKELANIAGVIKDIANK